MNNVRRGFATFRMVFCVGINGVKKMTRSASFYVLIFFATMFWYLFAWNIKSFAAGNGYGVTPHLLALFYADDSGLFYLYGMLLIVLVTCGAPFLNEDGEFTLQRTGRMPWCIGRMLYLLFANLIFQLVMFIAQIVVLLPYVTWSRDWGTVLYTVAASPELLSEYNGSGRYSSAIIYGMGAMDATLKEIALCAMLGAVVGAVVFLINGIFRCGIGSIVAAAGAILTGYLELMDWFEGWSLSQYLPFNWLNLKYYVDGTYDFSTNMSRLIEMFLVLAVIACVFIKKGWIRTTE